MAIPPKVLRDVLGNGESQYKLLLDIAEGRLKEKKTVKFGGDEIEIMVEAPLKLKAECAMWLLEQMHGKSVQRSEVAMAPTTLPSVEALSLDELRVVAALKAPEPTDTDKDPTE